MAESPADRTTPHVEPSASPSPTAFTARLICFALPLCLTAYFVTVSALGSPMRLAMPYALLLTLLYALLSFGLHGIVVLVQRHLPWLALFAGWAVGLVATVHLREQFGSPKGVAAFALTIVAAGTVYWLVARPARGRGLTGPVLTAGLLVAFVLLLVMSYRGSNTFRWHLLHHNRMLGTPLYYLLEDPVNEVRRAIWDDVAADGAEGSDAVERASDIDTAELLEGIRARESDRPSIVFILVDTLRADSLVPWGGAEDLAPQISRFAQDNVVMENVLANSSWTRPSVASFFTGRLQEQHGAVDRTDRLPESETTLAEALRFRGYTTAAFVTNFGAVGVGSGFAQGFDEFIEVQPESEERGQDYARASTLTKLAAGWLEENADGDEQPFFLYLHFMDPHQPYLSSDYEYESPEPSRPEYEDEVVYLDSVLGPFLQSLRSLVPEQTVILFTSDHGEAFDEHDVAGHGSALYWEQVDIPMVVSLPDGARGISDASLEARDFYRYLLELSDGLTDGVFEWARKYERRERYTSVYLTTDGNFRIPFLRYVCQRGVRQRDEILIWSGYGRTYELYDLAKDPRQLRNRYAERPERARELIELLDAPLQQLGQRAPAEMSEEELEMLRALGYLN